jgi:hypothetical protein
MTTPYQITYVGNGTTTDYTVVPGYIRKNHIKVKVNGVPTLAYSWFNDQVIRFNNAPGAGVTIEISRIPPGDEPLNTYTASVITPTSLNENFRQALQLSEIIQGDVDTAVTLSQSALAAVSFVLDYTPVVDLAALALLTPDDNDLFELQDSTGAETSPLITGITAGLVGSQGLTFRLQYNDSTGEYLFLQYYATDPETRYLKNVIKDFGAAGDGVADDTAALTAAFSTGGYIFVPKGLYRVVGTGVDSGGVFIPLTKSTRVVCDPEAVFIASDLDNDIIRFQVPADGVGVPADGIVFAWTGGTFDQRNQKQSTSVPFRTEYPAPAGTQGGSGTCDGLSIRGAYTVLGAPVSGVKLCVVSEVTTIAGVHWETAGGDTGIYVDGCEEQHVLRCRNVGSRDLGIYVSGDSTGVLRCRSLVEGNVHINCFHGNAIKRSTGFSKIAGNHAQGCVRGYLAETLIGNGNISLEITGNTGGQCGIMIRADDCNGFSISDNHFRNLGTLLADGTTIEDKGGADVIVTRGCTKGSVRYNTCFGAIAGLATTYALSSRRLIFCTANTASVQSTFVTWIGNQGSELASAGVDTGTSNQFIENVMFDSTSSPNMTALGTSAYEVRVDPTNGIRTFRNPVYFNDGSETAPALSRAAQPSVGMYFGTNKLGLCAGDERLTLTNTGMSFYGKPPVTRNNYGAPTGTATRTTFATSSVTLAGLAERVKAMIDDLKEVGLFE